MFVSSSFAIRNDLAVIGQQIQPTPENRRPRVLYRRSTGQVVVIRHRCRNRSARSAHEAPTPNTDITVTFATIHRVQFPGDAPAWLQHEADTTDTGYDESMSQRL